VQINHHYPLQTSSVTSFYSSNLDNSNSEIPRRMSEINFRQLRFDIVYTFWFSTSDLQLSSPSHFFSTPYIFTPTQIPVPLGCCHLTGYLRATWRPEQYIPGWLWANVSGPKAVTRIRSTARHPHQTY